MLREGSFTGTDQLEGAHLYSLGQYPMIILVNHSMPDAQVAGERYDIPESLLPTLDEFEDHPSVYQRQWLTLKSGRAAWVYVGQSHLVKGYRRILSGRWQDRIQSL